MKRSAAIRCTVLVSILMLTAAVLAPAQAAAPKARAAGGGIHGLPDSAYVPGQLLVHYRSTVSSSQRSAVRAANGSRLEHSLPVPATELVRLRSGQSVADGVAAFEARSEVVYAEPNYIYTADATPTDSRYGELWGLNNTGQTIAGIPGTRDADIDAPQAWDIATGDGTVVVADVDTGVAYDHPDLASRIFANPGETGGGKETNGVDDDGNGKIDDYRGWDFVSNDNDPRDFNGHGTHVAGTIGAAGNDPAALTTAVVGVNWNVRILPIRVLDGAGSGTNANIASGFTYAGTIGAKVLNASLGGPGFSETMRVAIAGAPNTLFVVAAGNEGANNETTPAYPCNYTETNLICIAATDQNDALADFSNFGTTSVDIGAPGVNILSTQPAFGIPVFSDDFEGPLSTKWITGGTPNTWARTTLAHSSGLNSVTDSPSGNYTNNANNWVQTMSAISLAGQTGCRLEYDLLLDVEGPSPSGAFFDGLYVEVSLDGITWVTVSGYAGQGAATNTEDVSALDGLSFFLRFRLQSDSDVNFDGAYIDDVVVKCLSATYGGTEYEFLDGTSMATPHTAGAVALVWSHFPTETLAQIRDRILNSGELKSALSGKTVTGRRLNVCRAIGGTVPVVSLSRSPSTVTYGSATTLSGVVANGGAPVGAAAVQIQRRQYGESGFSVLKGVTTAADGTFTTPTKPTKRSEYRAFFGGGGGICDALSSIVSVLVRPTITFNFADNTIRRGQTAVFGGSMNPRHAGLTLKLERRSGSSWVYIKSVTIASNGAYSSSYRPPSAGSFSFRMRFAGHADHTSAVSPARSLSVAV